MRKKKLFLLTYTVLFLFSFLIGKEIPIEEWLICHAKIYKPIFSDELNSLFDYSSIEFKSLEPQEGQELFWSPSQTLTWKKFHAENGIISFPFDSELKLVLTSTYIEVPQWQQISLSVRGNSSFQIFLDGELIENNGRTELSLTRGKHRLLIIFFQSKQENGIEVSLNCDERYESKYPILSRDPIHNMTLLEALMIPQFGEVEVSSDGSKAAVLNNEGGIEIFKLPDGILSRSIYLPNRISSFSWSPNGNHLAMGTSGEKTGCNLWLVNLYDGSTKKLFSVNENISQIQWLPDGKFIIFASTKITSQKKPYDLIDNFFDRWEGWKPKVSLWLASIDSGTKHMITGGINPYGRFTQAILSPNGEKVVFIREIPSSTYPYSHKEMWQVNILNGKSELISEIKTSMISSIIWSPDSNYLAVIAPYYNYPKKSSELANYHSRWHQGIQLWDLSKKHYRYLTEPEFNPCVRSLWWNPKYNQLYFIALDRTVQRLYRFSSDFNEFTEISLPFTNIQEIYGAKESDWVILSVGALDKPLQLFSINLKSLENHQIWNRGNEFLSLVQLGRTEIFNCSNREGIKIEGWLYFPPDFNPKEKYPIIVSYYGGIGPRIQRFDNINYWFAGNGYIVYQLTPRGAYGYGQKFADAHFNEWGTVSAPDIIDAVKALIKAKPFINSGKIGGYGHSYGGFEGLSLATQTDLFATIIATGVISNTLNYSFIVLGQPNNGEIVLPGVYPWNRKDVYIDRSPVFNANKINTPILLMQGTDDPWCEMTESDQIYSALKVQDKDVVQIRWIGEGHGISKFSNKLLFNRIMLEWFDKYLKDEPESWQKRYEESR